MASNAKTLSMESRYIPPHVRFYNAVPATSGAKALRNSFISLDRSTTPDR